MVAGLVFCRSYLLTLGVSARRRLRLVRRLGPSLGMERWSLEDYVKAGGWAGLLASVVERVLEISKKNRRVLAGKNPWVWAAAALWLASFKKLGLLKRLAEASGTTPASIRNAAKRLRV